MMLAHHRINRAVRKPGPTTRNEGWANRRGESSAVAPLSGRSEDMMALQAAKGIGEVCRRQ